MTSVKFETWAIVEIMGHQKYAGFCTEQPIAGSAFLRIDVPAVAGEPAFTKLFGGSAVFSLTPVTEDVARGVAAAVQKAPVNTWDLPAEWQEKLRSSRTLTVLQSRDDLIDERYCRGCSIQLSPSNSSGLCADCECEEE
jgi:hypothetical protein